MKTHKLDHHAHEKNEEKEEEEMELNLLALYLERIQFRKLHPGHIWSIWSLLHSGLFDINGLDTQGIPPMVHAGMRGNVVVLQLLLAYHADINATSSLRETALIAACRKKRMLAIQFLLLNGAQVEGIDRTGYSALRWAVTHNHRSLLRLLLKHNASVLKDSYTANSALEIAMAHKKRHQILQDLQKRLLVERRQLLNELMRKKERADRKAQRKQERKAKEKQLKQEEQAEEIKAMQETKMMQRQRERQQKILEQKMQIWTLAAKAVRPAPLFKDDHDERNDVDDEEAREAQRQLRRKGGKQVDVLQSSLGHKNDAVRQLLAHQFGASAKSSEWIRVGRGQWLDARTQSLFDTESKQQATENAAFETMVQSTEYGHQRDKILLQSERTWQSFARHVHTEASGLKYQISQHHHSPFLELEVEELE